MLTTFGALAPVFLLIAFGSILRGRGTFSVSFWAESERLVYWLLFPALLVVTTATAELEGFRVLPLALALIAAILLTAGAALALRPFLGVDGPGFSSVVQGAIRINTYVGLASASALYGEAGLTVAGVVLFFVIVTVNILSVGAIIRYGTKPARGREMLQGITRNPLIIACVAGFALNAVGLDLPEVARETLGVLGRASLALGLLCVGAGLDLSRVGGNVRAVGATCALKLLVMPAATALFCRLFGIEGLTAAGAVLFTSLPVSASSYVLARQLGGDAPLLAGLISISTIAAIVTMPFVLAIFT